MYADSPQVISKNKDVTRMITFRLRLTDLKKLDRFAKRKGLTRTRVFEDMIRRYCKLAKQEK
jgi:hypothetical protein